MHGAQRDVSDDDRHGVKASQLGTSDVRAVASGEPLRRGTECWIGRLGGQLLGTGAASCVCSLTRDAWQADCNCTIECLQTPGQRPARARDQDTIRAVLGGTVYCRSRIARAEQRYPLRRQRNPPANTSALSHSSKPVLPAYNCISRATRPSGANRAFPLALAARFTTHGHPRIARTVPSQQYGRRRAMTGTDRSTAPNFALLGPSMRLPPLSHAHESEPRTTLSTQRALEPD